jgi:hypothetical protein
MKRVAIAIGVVLIIAVGAVLWARVGSRLSHTPATPARSRAAQEKSLHGLPGPVGQVPDAGPGADAGGRIAERTGTRQQADTRSQAGPPNEEDAGRPPAPGGSFGGWAPPSEMSEADRANMRGQMVKRMLDEAGLTANEKSAATTAIKAKDKARQALADQLTSLRRAANRSHPTDKELTEALAAYRSAMARYRREVASQDAALVKQLSLRGQARLLSLGVLDNGLGGFGPGGPGGPRPPR